MQKICAGIVTFQPELDRLKKSLSCVTAQVDMVFVIDNNSSNIADIKNTINLFDNVTLVENNHNNGIARALNQMCENADKHGYEWILTLDQDTIIPSRMVSTFKRYTIKSNIGIICPAVYYEGRDEVKKKKKILEYVYACMTSASLTNIQAWREAGGFRESYFIDYVDNEFCMKLGLHHYKILKVNSCVINHQLGKSGIKKILGLRIRYSSHSPIRLYYMARNNSSFIREYSKYLSVGKEIIKLLYVLVQELLFSDKKRESMHFILLGLKDSRNGITGEYIYR